MRSIRFVPAACVTLALALPLAFAPAAAASATAAWAMNDCHGAATLALAPLESVQASLPPGYTAMDAAVFLGSAVATGEYGYVGVEVWECGSVTLGDVTSAPATYGSAAAVIEPPPGAAAATLYFYKYENFLSSQALVQQSERLGAPAKLVTSSSVTSTAAGAIGTVTLADGGTYTVTTTDLGPMEAGNFHEWHEHGDVVSHWQAAFTIAPGYQGSGDLTAPAGSQVAGVMGASSGSGLGIHTWSTFQGGIDVTRK